MLDAASTYHICPKRELFASFEELDGGLMSMGDDHTCRFVGRGTVRIRMYDGTLRELKDVRNIPSMKKNIILVGGLEAEGLKGTLGEGILKMSSGSLVILKGIRRNNMYYLMDSTVTRLASSGQLDGNSIKSWHSGHGQVGLKLDQALGGASTCHLKACDSSVLDKKKVKFDTDTHDLHGLLELVQVDVWGPTKTVSLGGHRHFVSIVDDYSKRVGYSQ